VIDTTKINGNAPAHRSQVIEFGAYVPNRLQRGHAVPLRHFFLEPGRGLAPCRVVLRILTAVHS
jgi:hypothetical protein